MPHANLAKNKLAIAASLLALMLIAFSVGANAGVIHKCTSPSGAVSFTDQPCPSDSKSKNIKPDPIPPAAATTQPAETDTPHQAISTAPQKKTSSAGEDPECAAMEKHQTPDELLAKADALLHDGKPNGHSEVCCKNGHVVPCNQMLIKPKNW